VARKKVGADRWLEIMEVAHGFGMKTSVTMMYGLGESYADRIEHLFRVRELQDRTGGFTAFICWPLQPDGTEMADQPRTDAVSYLRTLAMARILLTNVPNLQSSWVTMGLKVGQVALRFGANDFGSLMMEETWCPPRAPPIGPRSGRWSAPSPMPATRSAAGARITRCSRRYRPTG
jgi:cyclic dehypoxanthinyl futalosine synthase